MENSNNGGSAANVENVSPQVALHIAIQTMKERCQTLQQRLTIVEDENRQLRQNAGTDRPRPNSGHSSGHSELENLREKVAELTRQKSQLTEHIAMVATENRQLWSRLSKITKDNQSLGDSLQKMKNSLITSTTTDAATTSTNQHLIRSKTFTQNSPNPALRPKNQNLNQTEDDQMSLEEISLKVLNEFLEGKDKVEKQCKEFIEENSIGFGYLNDDCATTGIGDGDNQTDKKILDDGMGDIKKELLRQQSDLKVALSRLRQRKDWCQTCKNKNRKSNTADKNLGTEEHNISTISLTDFKLTSAQGRDDAQIPSAVATASAAISKIDFIERKRIADTIDKMCPMCGQIYTCESTFDEFQDHVESHFIDESELDISFDKNFELISHTVGDF